MKLFGAKKEVRKTDKSVRACREAFDALNKLKEDMQKPVGEVSGKFFNIVKRFFSNYFNVKFEFTHDEFIKELKKKRSVGDNIKDKVTSFSQELSDIKYHGNELTAEQLKKTIQAFNNLVFFLSDRKKHETASEQTRRLTDYVKFALEKGKTKDEIEKALIDAGWPIAVIGRELNHIK